MRISSEINKLRLAQELAREPEAAALHRTLVLECATTLGQRNVNVHRDILGLPFQDLEPDCALRTRALPLIGARHELPAGDSDE